MAKTRQYGEGSIYRDGNRYRAQISIGKDENGKIKYKKFSGATEQEVKKKLREFKAQANKFSCVNNKLTLSEYLDHWLNDYQKNKIKSQSFDRLENTVRIHIKPTIGCLQISTIRTLDIQELINNKYYKEELSYSSVKKIYDALNAAFKFNLSLTPQERVVEYNPCEAVIMPSEPKFKKKMATFFNEGELEKIKNEIGANFKHVDGKKYPYGAAYILILNTGLRVGECSALNKSDIDIENRRIYIGKNYVRYKKRNKKGEASGTYIAGVSDGTKTYTGQRWINLNNAAFQACQELMNLHPDTDSLVTSKEKSRVIPQQLERTFKTILKNCAIEDQRNIHTLRHTFASLLIKRNIGVKTVSNILGHSSIKITLDTYTHLFEEQKIKAMESIPDI